MASNALYLFEQIQFPEQAPQTSTDLVLPGTALPLTKIADDDWQDNHFLVPLAISALRILLTWLQLHFDPRVHAETFDAVKDSLLVFESIEHILNWKSIAAEAIALRISTMPAAAPASSPSDNAPSSANASASTSN